MPPRKKSKKSSRAATSSSSTAPSPEDGLEENRRDEIILTFQHALKKGEKTLSVSKAKEALKTLGIEAKTDEIQSFMGGKKANDDESSIIDFNQNQFLRFAALRMLQMDKAYKAFELMDQDGKGVVVLEDLQRVSQELGENFTDEELQEMMELVDESGDGLLGPQDFVRLARKVNL